MATSTTERHRVSCGWMPTLSLGGLWRHADFRRLWAAQSVSLLGSEITALALPLMAVLALNASPGEMGLLAAAGTAPFLLCSLPGGGLGVPRPRRPGPDPAPGFPAGPPVSKP